MASVSVPTGEGGERLWANPWSWMGLGLACCTLGWLAMLIGGARFPAVRLGLIVVGLLSVGGALSLRLQCDRPSLVGGWSRPARNLLLLALSALFAVLAVGVSVMLVVCFVTDGRWGTLLICWSLIGPLSAVAASQCLRRVKSDEPLSGREEAALLLPLAALACQAASAAMYYRTDPQFLDTIRFFLGVVSVIALVCAPLVLAQQRVRRVIASALIVLHFGCVFTAALAFQNSHLLHQIIARLSRPYLDFFSLGNAFNYFAPDPGSGSVHLWCRVLFEDGPDSPAPLWIKVPEADRRVDHSNAADVNFTRRLSLLLRINSASPPALLDMNARPTDIFRARLDAADPRAASWDLYVPFSSEVPVMQQCLYPFPAATVQRLLRSYLLHVIHQAEKDGRRVKAVKVYRVTHQFPSVLEWRAGIKEMWDPDTYVPIYMGDFDAQGNPIYRSVLIHGVSTAGLLGTFGDGPLPAAATLPPGRAWVDPFLYWILPTVREPTQPPTFRSYVRKHAGDPDWIRDRKGNWVQGNETQP